MCRFVKACNEETFGSSESSSIEVLPSCFGTLPTIREMSALDQLASLHMSENNNLMVAVFDVSKM